jgi:hypothetical protein
MGLDETILNKKLVVLDLARFYFKGFGNCLAGVLGNAEYYCRYNKEAACIEKSLKLIDMFDEFYAKIPFEQLEKNSDYAPLFVVRDLLPKVRVSLNGLVQNKEHSFDDLKSLVNAVHEVGMIYRKKFDTLRFEIRSFPGEENFRIHVVDYKGVDWYI